MMIFHRPFLSLVVFSLCRDIIVQYCTKRWLHMWISTRTTTTKLRVRNCRQQVRRFVKQQKKRREGRSISYSLPLVSMRLPICVHVHGRILDAWVTTWVESRLCTVVAQTRKLIKGLRNVHRTRLLIQFKQLSTKFG